MVKKEKTEPKEKKEVQKEQYTNYLYPRVEIPQENQGWMHIKFFVNDTLILIENNWHFADFELDMKAKDPIFYALRKIELRHGKICNIKLYRDADKKEEQQNIIYLFAEKQYLTKDRLTIQTQTHVKIKFEFTDLLGDIYKTQGEMKKQDSKSFSLYYEFDVNIKSPLLLYEMN